MLKQKATRYSSMAIMGMLPYRFQRMDAKHFWGGDIEVPDAGARVVRARNSGKMEVRGRQAMADSTLARFCPHRSMAPVLAIMRLAAAALKEAALTPLERVAH